MTEQLEKRWDQGDTSHPLPPEDLLLMDGQDATQKDWSYGREERLFAHSKYFQVLQVEEQELTLDRKDNTLMWGKEERRGQVQMGF